jgi:hypothetical protein
MASSAPSRSVTRRSFVSKRKCDSMGVRRASLPARWIREASSASARSVRMARCSRLLPSRSSFESSFERVLASTSSPRRRASLMRASAVHRWRQTASQFPGPLVRARLEGFYRFACVLCPKLILPNSHHWPRAGFKRTQARRARRVLEVWQLGADERFQSVLPRTRGAYLVSFRAQKFCECLHEIAVVIDEEQVGHTRAAR